VLLQVSASGKGATQGKRTLLAVNKAEGIQDAIAGADFQSLGMGSPWTISSAHGEGVGDLLADVLARFPEDEPEPLSSQFPFGRRLVDFRKGQPPLVESQSAAQQNRWLHGLLVPFETRLPLANAAAQVLHSLCFEGLRDGNT
jgi:hypothetical protein